MRKLGVIIQRYRVSLILADLIYSFFLLKIIININNLLEIN